MTAPANIVRPEYRDWPADGTVPPGYDVVSTKLDGQWATCEVNSDSTYTITGRNGRLLDEGYTDAEPCILVGEMMVGTQRAKESVDHGRFVAFDMIQLGLLDLRHQPLAVRVERLYAWDTCGLCYRTPTTGVGTIASYLAADPYGEGVVYKRSTDPYEGAIWYRAKHVVTHDLKVVEVGIGASGRVSLHVEGPTGATIRVAAGISTDMQDRMRMHPAEWIGRTVEVRGHGLTQSGKLRHPVYVRARPDK